MEYGQYGHFTDGGKKYEIITPLTPMPWQNHLFHDDYDLELDQTLQGTGYLVENYNRTPVFTGWRYFYLLDRADGSVWNPNYVPLCSQQDLYVCRHGLWSTEMESAANGIRTQIQAVIPVTDEKEKREIWKVLLKNTGDVQREISLFVAFGFYDHGVMGGECTYDETHQTIIKYAFPYHTLYEEKEKVEKKDAFAYLFSDRRPDSWEMSKRRFFGGQTESQIPAGVRCGKLSKITAEAEDFCGAFSYELTLEPGEQTEIFLEAGAAVSRETIWKRSRAWGRKKAVTDAERTCRYWEELCGSFVIDTPDEDLNSFGNYWLKKQILWLTRLNRGTSYCPVRNQLQDAMGYAMIQPEKAWPYICGCLKLQNRDGFLQQWYDTTGAPPRGLCLLHHTDAPVWLVICTEAAVRQLGDQDIFKTQIPYKDGGSGSVLEHLEAALRYLAERLGPNGMCLIGDGDWNDPMNGAGREGRGESVWLSMAFLYAVRLMLPYLREEKRESAGYLEKAAAQMKVSINQTAWCGNWYAAAVHDDGSLLGDETDRLFLNTQSWAIMSGVDAEEEGEQQTGKREKIRNALKQLETPFGPLILWPPFDGWDRRWGRMSIKKSGTTENGSVYCHASMFLAYAQAMMGDGDGLYRTLCRTLPTNPENPPEKNLQVPIYLANYYYGLRDSANFGRSSQHYGTGTVAWMLMLLEECLMGVRPEVGGLTVKPCLPKDWAEAECKKSYRQAVYQIRIRRGEKKEVRVDGVPYERNMLPYEKGRSYLVEITIASEK